MCEWYEQCKSSVSGLPKEKINKFCNMIMSGKGLKQAEHELDISNEQSLGIIALSIDSLSNGKNEKEFCYN